MSDYVARLGSVDLLKGVLIVAIVFVHLVLSRSDILFGAADAAVDIGPQGESTTSLLIQALYLGLMIFFIFSGYFYRPGRGFKENMRKRFFQLVVALSICAIVLPIIIYIWMAVWGKAPDISDILIAFQWGFGLNGVFEPLDVFTEHPICGACVGYYFLWGMVWGFLIFYAVADRVYGDWKKTVLVIAILLVVTTVYRMFVDMKLPFYAQIGPIAAAFMLAGMLLAEHDVIAKIESFSFRSAKCWGIFLGSVLLAVVLVYLFPSGLEFDYLNIGRYGWFSAFIYFVEAMVMFVVMMHLSVFLSKASLIRELFDVPGRHTLGILLLHGFVATMMFVPFFNKGNGSWVPDDMGLAPSLIIALATVVVCVIICEYGKKYLEKGMDKFLTKTE